MIRNNQFAKYFTQVFILCFRCVVPLGSLYLLIRFLPPEYLPIRFPWYFESYLVAEVLFYLFVFLPLLYFRQTPQDLPPPLPERKQREQLWQKCLETISDPEKFVTGWTGVDRLEDVCQGDLTDWLSWALLNKIKPDPKDEDELEHYVYGLEHLLKGHRFRKGRNIKGDLPMRISSDEMNVMHRPLVYYILGIGGSDFLSYLWMTYHGYRFYSLKRIFTSIPFRPQTIFSTHRSPAEHTAYWYRPHTSRTRLPVLYIHGIGILHTYLSFFAELAAAFDKDHSDGQVGIIVLDVAPISFRMTHAALTAQNFVNEVSLIVASHGWDQFVLVGNSFGSALSLQLLRSSSLHNKVADVLMIDPVPFLLHCPEMVHNFLRRSPVKASEWQLWYFASADIGASHTLSRRFLWSENILWQEDMTRDDSDLAWKFGTLNKQRRRWTVILSRDDIIVDALAVGKYLTRKYRVTALEDNRGVDELRRDVSGFASASKELVTKAHNEQLLDVDSNRDNQSETPLTVLWFDELNHAEGFDYKHTRKAMIDVVLDYSKA